MLRDARRTPIRFGGYAVSFRGGHPHVRIDRDDYLNLKSWMLDWALRSPMPALCRAFRRVPFEPYAPVRRQVLCIWRAVNRARKAAGMEPVPVECVRVRRNLVRPFEEQPDSSLLLPAQDEVAAASIAAESDDVEGHPKCAACDVDRVHIGDNGGRFRRAKQNGARGSEGERPEVDRPEKVPAGPPCDDRSPTGMAGLEGEQRLARDPIDPPLDLIEP